MSAPAVGGISFLRQVAVGAQGAGRAPREEGCAPIQIVTLTIRNRGRIGVASSGIGTPRGSGVVGIVLKEGVSNIEQACLRAMREIL